MLTQGFGFTGDFLKEWNNSVYCRVQKIRCRFKELARACHSCEKCGLKVELYNQALEYLSESYLKQTTSAKTKSSRIIIHLEI